MESNTGCWLLPVLIAYNADGYGKWANHPATMKGFDHLLYPMLGTGFA